MTRLANLFKLLCGLGVLFIIAGCGGGGSANSSGGSNQGASFAITSVSPNPVPGAGTPQLLTIKGSGFLSGATVTLHDETTVQVYANLASDSFSSTQITISRNFTTAPDNWSVEIINPSGASSGKFPFSIAPPPGTPAITGVTPNPVPGADVPQIFTISGTGFVSGATVTLRDVDASLTFANQAISSFSGTQIVISSIFGTTAHQWSVEVINPSGTTSGQYYFHITTPAVTPTITSVSPNPVPGSNTPQAFTIDGSGFDVGATVTLYDNTAGQVFANPSIVSSSSSEIVISQNFTTAQHNWSVKVTNPSGIASLLSFFSVGVPIGPVITSVSPNPVPGSNIAQAFTIDGSGFDAGSTVTLYDDTAQLVFNPPIVSSSSSEIVISQNFTTARHNWSVKVTNSSGAPSLLAYFSVGAPAGPEITSVSPNPVQGSNSAQAFTINGSGFDVGATVTLYDDTASQVFTPLIISSSSTVIIVSQNFTTAPHAWSAKVTNSSSAPSLLYYFNVVAPAGP